MANFRDEIERQALEALRKKARKVSMTLRCADHGERPKVKVTGNRMASAKIDFEVCCESMKDRASKAMEGEI